MLLGHLTRLAVHELHAQWNKSLPTRRRLGLVEEVLRRFGNPDDLARRLAEAPLPEQPATLSPSEAAPEVEQVAIPLLRSPSTRSRRTSIASWTPCSGLSDPSFSLCPTFEAGYERLKRETSGFREVTPEHVAEAVLDEPISLIVLRCMLGFTPPEWAYLATSRDSSGVR